MNQKMNYLSHKGPQLESIPSNLNLVRGNSFKNYFNTVHHIFT
jgi:hypothetical protein